MRTYRLISVGIQSVEQHKTTSSTTQPNAHMSFSTVDNFVLSLNTFGLHQREALGQLDEYERVGEGSQLNAKYGSEFIRLSLADP